jgi:hypothetical protein
MSMHRRPPSRRTILMAGMALAFSSAASRARAEAAAPAEPAPVTPPAQAEPPPVTPPAQEAPPSVTPPAPVPPTANLPAPKPTATAKRPATVFVNRPSAGGDAVLDLSVRAFRPPWRGAVEAVVSLKESKQSGREAEVGSFTIFPTKAFQATKPEDERGFRLDATQALSELGAGTDPLAVKVRLASLREGRSAAGARLTLGKVQLIPRAEIK